ncbi:MAG: VacJ family lipoprotein [Sulfurospirillaceae bacterium]|nr:VacJ family lipoprotein [Sulfurospirillaceae bacterium]
MRVLFAIFLLVSSIYAVENIGTSTYIGTSSVNNSATEYNSFDEEFSVKNTEEEIDPLSGYNRLMTEFNDVFYIYLLNPTAKGYSCVAPKEARLAISNFFENLFFPIRLINNLLQFKFQNSLEETERFVINSTIGILGFMDVAKDQYNINPHNEDFGQTLGYYGVGSGFHVVLPFLGPSNLRDMVGIFGDSWANPISYIDSRSANLLDSDEESIYATSFHVINKASLHLNEYENIKKDAVDLYPFLKNFYESRREKLIKE